MNTIKILFAVLLFSGFTLFSQAEMIDDVVKRGTLRVGTDPVFMPFQMRDKRGDIVGFEVDLNKAIATALGVKLEIVSISFDGIIPGLLTDKFDLIAAGMTLTQERNLKIGFSAPFISVGQTLLIRKELAGEVKSYKDLNSEKYQIASKIGTTGEIVAKRLMSRARYHNFDTADEALVDLVNGKIDGFVFDSSYNLVALEKRGAGKLIHLDEPFTYEPLAFGLKRDDQASINWINNWLIQIRNDGTYERLYKKWFKNSDWIKHME